jgi:uncharacterized protein YyaL (SSP411 family)
MPNRLAGETSPYLLQHKDNPVDWYPWGDEAFARAKEEDKPLFVSIGYAACHWCHVMEHESFENPEIAALMNSLFVNVKVDREERPDVDAVYMNAIHVMGEGGGWPLSAFCDPEGRPFFLGTYFPPGDKYGRPGFARVLKTMSQVYREKREQVAQNASAVLQGLKHMDEHFRRHARKAGGPGELEVGMLVASGRQLAQMADAERGGFGRRPKFPSSSAHDLLARASRLPFGAPAREAFLLQCREMAAGGIYDHLGGGFARYSVDERWLVPHFEKMLYDNGQLLAIYGDAYAMTGEARYAELIDETVGWLVREMQDAGSGGLYASQDADSEGEEGKFYVWTPEEVRRVLGDADGEQFARAYGVTDGGNFEHETSVLSRIESRGSEEEERALAGMRERLFAERAGRVPPATDTKVLAGWNGLAVSGLLRAAGATGNPRALAVGLQVADFLANRMVHAEGARIWRVYKDGQTRLDGTLDDYAMVARAFLDVAEALEDPVWWRRGVRLVEEILARFHAEEDGVSSFYLPAVDSDDRLIHRPESNHDGATPSGAAVAIECLLRLGLAGGDQRALAMAESYLAGRAPQAASQPYMGARLLAGLDFYLNGAELVVSQGEGRAELLAAARRVYAPTLMIAGPWAPESIRGGKEPAGDGRAQAYLCRGQSCSPPVADPDQLRELLAAAPS